MAEPDRATYEAAERLVREAQARAEEAAQGTRGEVPPDGWSTGPGPAPAPGASPFPDVGALLALVESLRGTIPPELARALTDALRELLIAIRAILDYSIEQLDRPPSGEREVEDIPIS